MMTLLTSNSKKGWPTISRLFLQKNFLRDNLSERSFNWLCLGIPLAVSLVVKLILLSILHQGTINIDGILYINAAKQYAAGNMATGLSIYPMPVYPMLIALTHTMITNWINAGYFISIISMVLATIPLYYLTKTMFGIKEAFWASLIFALLPKMNEWSLYVSRDSLFLLISACFIYVGLKSRQKPDLILFGTTFVLAWTSILIRIEGLVFIIFYAVVLIYDAFTADEQKERHYFKILLWGGVPLVIALITIGFKGLDCIGVNRFDQVFTEFVNLFRGDTFQKYFQIYNFFSEAENHPPFSGWHYNFAALSRHYLLIIYMMGIMEILGKLIFPLSYIPLYQAMKKSFTAQEKYVLWIFFLFIGVVYYSLLTRDFVATRFLMIPAFLLLPWIGYGTNKLWRQRTNTYHKALTMFLVFSLILAPTVKTFCLIGGNDNTIPRAAKWLTKNSTTKQMKIITNNNILPFYAKMETDNNPDWTVHVYKDKDIKGIEPFAIKKEAAIIILKMRIDKNKKMPGFDSFKEITRFTNGKETTAIYIRKP